MRDAKIIPAKTVIRQKAENLVNKRTLKTTSPLTESEILKLIHELEVHQIELELQNEELRYAKEQAADAASKKYAELYDFAPSGYFTLTKTGEIIDLNLFGSQMLGKERINLKGSMFGFFVSDHTRPGFNQFLKKIFKSNMLESCEVELTIIGKFSVYAHLTGIVMAKSDKCLITAIDITERKKTENDLVKAKEKAEESDRLKSAFLRNISHEIRSPMNAIMGFSKLLINKYNDKAKLERFSTLLNQRCEDLLDIINEILDIAKIESGSIPVYFEECNLDSFFEELSVSFKEIQTKLGKQHIRYTVQEKFETLGKVIIIDPNILKQIFNNLINNAFKFTEKGNIQAGCEIDKKNRLVFYVSDTGIGIPADKHSNIFEYFTQLDYDTTRVYGGTGLGLSIVKGLINILDGEIWLESVPGKGSKFFFTFPYQTIANLPDEELNSDNEIVEYRFPNKTILIVEDDLYNANYLKELLRDTGLNILHTMYGKEAVQISITQPLNLILMDLRLPDLDGYETTSRIRQYKPDLKIIAQSAYTSTNARQKALDAGCNEYISKPLDQHLLLYLISKELKAKPL